MITSAGRSGLGDGGIGKLSVDGELAAVAHQHGAVAVARLVGREERDAGGDLLGLADPAGRDAAEMIRALVRQDVLDQRGADHARGDRVDPDAQRGQVDRHRLGQHDQAALGRVVVRQPGLGDQPVGGRGVHDGRRSLGGQLRDQRLGAQERAGQVDLDDPLPVLVLDLAEAALVPDTGVVDQDVRAAQRRRPLGERRDLGRVPHVAQHRGDHPLPGELRRRPLQFLRPVGDRHDGPPPARNAAAVALPIPELAPVTTTVLPPNRPPRS